MKIQLKRSNVLDSGSAKEPTPEQMEYGELAVNYSAPDPALFIKDAEDNIVRIAGANSVSGETPGDGTITIKQPGIDDQTFTVNQSSNTEINLLNDNTVTTPGNGTITIKQPGADDQSFTVNQEGDTQINLKNDNTVVTPGNGALLIRIEGQEDTQTGTYTADQSDESTITLPAIDYNGLSNLPTLPSGNFLSLDSGAGNQTIASTGTVTNKGKLKLDFGTSGSTTFDQSSANVLNFSGSEDRTFYRFTTNSSGSENYTLQVATGLNANSAINVNKRCETTSQQAYPKSVLANFDMKNSNITGGSSNALNSPAVFASSVVYNGSTQCSSFSLFNCQAFLSDNPGTINNIPVLVGFNFQNQGIGYNDGTVDLSLRDTKIAGYNTNVANDGTCAGSTNVWTIFANGDAPMWHRGVIKCNNGIEFSGDNDNPIANSKLVFDQYEEGTFTPVMSGSGTALSYSARTGWYIISGDLCTVNVDITYSGGSGNGQIVCSLPFTGKPVTGTTSGYSGGVNIVSAASVYDTPIIARCASASQVVLIKGGGQTQSTAAAKVRYSDIPSGQLRFQITYSI